MPIRNKISRFSEQYADKQQTILYNVLFVG